MASAALAPLAAILTAKPQSQQPPTPMIAQCLALSRYQCAICNGTGLTGSAQQLTCGCVNRGAFCSVVRRVVAIRASEFGYPGPRRGARNWSWPRLELCADVERIARKHLTPVEWKVFRLNSLEGWDWHTGVRQTGLNKGDYFHAIYRIQAKLGAAFSAAGLCPVDEYLS